MYNEQLEQLIEAALTDGVLTDKEKQVLFKKAESLGIDKDEFEMVLDARLVKAQQAQQPVHAAKEKLGNIVTCPNCGAQIPGGAAVCPECGYEFRNTEANRSVQRFTEGLLNINNKQSDSVGFGKYLVAAGLSVRAKKTPTEVYISTFPVPNTADDLLEFLSFVQGQARKHDLGLYGSSAHPEYVEEHAFWGLYEKCINMAKINFAGDPRFIPFFEYHKEQKKKLTPEGKTRMYTMIVAAVIFALLFIGFSLMAKFL